MKPLAAKRALARPSFCLPAAPAGAYRVEHRVGGAATVLGEAVGVAAHHTALVPWLAPLRPAGGELVLVDPATGAVVARRLGPAGNRNVTEATVALPYG